VAKDALTTLMPGEAATVYFSGVTLIVKQKASRFVSS
jgi:hypothetical protein